MQKKEKWESLPLKTIFIKSNSTGNMCLITWPKKKQDVPSVPLKFFKGIFFQISDFAFILFSNGIIQWICVSISCINLDVAYKIWLTQQALIDLYIKFYTYFSKITIKNIQGAIIPCSKHVMYIVFHLQLNAVTFIVFAAFKLLIPIFLC